MKPHRDPFSFSIQKEAVFGSQIATYFSEQLCLNVASEELKPFVNGIQAFPSAQENRTRRSKCVILTLLQKEMPQISQVMLLLQL